MDTFSPETLIPLLSQHMELLLLAIVGLVIYGALADRAVFEGKGAVLARPYDRRDALIALLIVFVFAALVAAQVTVPAKEPENPARLPGALDMIAGIIFNEFIFVGLAAGPLVALRLRGIRLREAFGLEKWGVGAVFLMSFVLLLFALPLITETLQLSRVLLAGAGYRNTDPQETVQFLSKSPSYAARVAVGFQAVVLAPVQEELIFRGYLYPVTKRFLGPALGGVIVSLLFAAIHLHAPSFAGLFVLAACLTLAYEWSGSILVPMTMHAMFNALTVINLLVGGTAQN